jgi:hypothetical protein
MPWDTARLEFFLQLSVQHPQTKPFRGMKSSVLKRVPAAVTQRGATTRPLNMSLNISRFLAGIMLQSSPGFLTDRDAMSFAQVSIQLSSPRRLVFRCSYPNSRQSSNTRMASPTLAGSVPTRTPSIPFLRNRPGNDAIQLDFFYDCATKQHGFESSLLFDLNSPREKSHASDCI